MPTDTRIAKSMPITEWRKYPVIQSGVLGHSPYSEEMSYLIVTAEGRYWFVEYSDYATYKNADGSLDAISGEVVEMQPRLVWVGKNWLDGEDEVKVVKEGPVHGKLVWSHDPGPGPQG